MVEPSERLKGFMVYVSAAIDNARDEAQAKGYRILDFGVGDPTEPLYEGAIKGIQSGAEKYSMSGYPSYIGMKEFRSAASSWLERRFGVKADPNTQITSTIGSKEATFHLPFAILNPGDSVLMPSIGYPTYKSGTIFSGGIPEYFQLREENSFQPSLDEIEAKLKANKRIKLIWVNYPNNPTTVMATDAFYEGLVELCQKRGVIIGSDEAYTEMYIKKRPRSILEFTDDWSNIMVFQSLSKRSNATGIRIGFAVGGKELINYYRKLRTQIDSGVPSAIQEGAIAALADEEHVQKMRESYDKKRGIITKALDQAKIKYWADATFYIWAKPGGSAQEFSKSLLKADEKRKIGINTIPGGMNALGDAPDADKYVRFALVPSIEDTKLAAELIKNNL